MLWILIALVLGLGLGAVLTWFLCRSKSLSLEAMLRLESQGQLNLLEQRLAEVNARLDRELKIQEELKTGFQQEQSLRRQEQDARITAETLAARLPELHQHIAERDQRLESAQTQIQQLIAQKSQLEASLEERDKAFEEARQRLEERFQALAGQTLQANSEGFLQLARSTMLQAQTEAKSDLDARSVAMAGLLEPLKQALSTLETQVKGFQESRLTGETELRTQIQNLVGLQQNLQGETSRLANALRKPQVRGRWGELQLQNLVELAGMQEHVDFTTQASMSVGEQRRRPDLLIHLPGGKCIAVDAKTPLGAYLDALEATTEEERRLRMESLPEHIRTHVAQLADKRYYEGLPQSPDFVVLFLHGEGAFALACEKDPKLLEDALRQNVLLATPVTLMALLKSAAYGWQQQRLQENADLIRETAAELVKRLATMGEHIQDLREGLVKAVGSYNKFSGSLEHKVLPQARKILSLGVAAYRKKGESVDFPALEAIDEAPRDAGLRLL